MNFTDLLKAVLVILVRFVLVSGFAAIGIEVDQAFLDNLVAGIVIWFLGQFGVELVATAVPSLRKKGFLAK